MLSRREEEIQNNLCRLRLIIKYFIGHKASFRQCGSYGGWISVLMSCNGILEYWHYLSLAFSSGTILWKIPFLSSFQHNRDSDICIFNFMRLKWESNVTVMWKWQIRQNRTHSFLYSFVNLSNNWYMQILCQAVEIQASKHPSLQEFSV